jgi:hypothetical protein
LETDLAGYHGQLLPLSTAVSSLGYLATQFFHQHHKQVATYSISELTDFQQPEHTQLLMMEPQCSLSKKEDDAIIRTSLYLKLTAIL